MQCTKMTVGVLVGALALAFGGCKYNDAAEGGAGAGGVGNAGDSVANSTMIGTVEDEDGVPATAVSFDQDPNYERCTDVSFAPVYFGFDASALSQDELGKIEAVAQHLAQNEDRVVMIEGNCDERGSNEYNMSLGTLRATAVRDYLVTLSTADKRIQTKSYGEENPAVAGSGENAWSRNRRGEFVIFRHK